AGSFFRLGPDSRPGAGHIRELPGAAGRRGMIGTVDAPPPGAIGGGSGFRLGSAFAPGAVLLHRNPAAASSPGHALSRRSTRPGCDWGWLGVLAGVRFRTGGGAPTPKSRSRE